MVKDAEGNEVQVTIDPSGIAAESESPVGDVNEDGVFNSLDLVQLLQAGKYGTGQPATYAQGDFDGNGGSIGTIWSMPCNRAATRAASMPVSTQRAAVVNDAQTSIGPRGSYRAMTHKPPSAGRPRLLINDLIFTGTVINGL